MASEGFWDNQDFAKKTVAKIRSLKAQIEPLTGVIADLEKRDTRVRDVQGSGGQGPSGRGRSIPVHALAAHGAGRKAQPPLDPHDTRNCFLTIKAAGVGGTEANDWADMLLRMYIFYCEKMGFSLEEVDKGFGSEVGIDSVTLHVKGPYAFGYLKCEPRHAPPRTRLALQRPAASVKRRSRRSKSRPSLTKSTSRSPTPNSRSRPSFAAREWPGRAERQQGRGASDPRRAQADGDHGRREHVSRSATKQEAGSLDLAGTLAADGRGKRARPKSRPHRAAASTAAGAPRSVRTSSTTTA